jgi:hypothetical protein
MITAMENERTTDLTPNERLEIANSWYTHSAATDVVAWCAKNNVEINDRGHRFKLADDWADRAIKAYAERYQQTKFEELVRRTPDWLKVILSMVLLIVLSFAMIGVCVFYIWWDHERALERLDNLPPEQKEMLDHYLQWRKDNGLYGPPPG